MPVSVIEIVNGDLKGEVVAYAFLANEIKETLTQMLLKFVDETGKENFEDTKCLVVVKDYSEIGAIRTVTPNAEVHLCSVHAERTMKDSSKLEPQKEKVVASMRGMIYSETEEEFERFYDNFKEVASPTPTDYFARNWANIKEKWSIKDKVIILTLRNYTTNRVEVHNKNIKMVRTVPSDHIMRLA